MRRGRGGGCVFCWGAAAVVLALSGAAGGQTAQINDVQFLDGDWAHYLRSDSGPGSQTVSRQVTPENPTGYQEGTHNWDTTTLRTAHVYTAGGYTPSTQGPLGSVDFSFAFRMTYGSPSIKSMQAGLVLRQGGQTYVYSGVQTFAEDPTWGSFAGTGLGAADFGQVTAGGVDWNTHPDFSCTGGTIEFGYTAISTSSKSNSSLTWNIDDYAVAVHYTTAGDCNGNGTSDECELINGVTPDCDGNDVPDDCQPNCDGDDVPDVCEIDPTDPDGDGEVSPDCDVNGVPDACQPDDDGDGYINACETCPNDPGKQEPGVCGCGVPDVDTDDDGTMDCNDECPLDPGKTVPGQCGCGVADTDTDSDGTADCNDQCPQDPSKTVPGQCGCGVADTDTDSDGTADCNDLCPNDPAKTEPGLCGCGTADTDTDGDGTPDCNDQCPEDPAKIEPGLCGCGTADTDTDVDGVPDCTDNCPYTPNPGQEMVCEHAANVVSVRWDATGANTGRNWVDAYTDLQAALSAARDSGGTITEIWVARGTYKPTSGTDRLVSFHLVDGVGMYGGFEGTEISRDQRDAEAYETILSGDLLGNDVGGLTDPSRDENSICVLYANEVSSDTVLDGFTVTGGKTSDTGSGGGIYVDGGSPRISNCLFTRNTAKYGGGVFCYYSTATISRCRFIENGTQGGCGAYNNHSSTRITDCVFLGNAGSNGGALYNTQSSHAKITNCLFVGNTASMAGGAVCNYDSDPTFTNCTIVWNKANSGGGLYDYYAYSYATINNCVLWGNTTGQITNLTAVVSYTCIQGGWSLGGSNNISLDPKFMRNASPGPDGLWNGVNDDYGDLHLQGISPCIDAGDKTRLPAGTVADLDGYPRVQHGQVDMGVYEYQDCNGNGILDSEEPDADGDLVIDDCDNCPEDANLDQADMDGDGIGDACDPDRDGDDVPNESDNCPDTVNADQADLDEDGLGDACDDDIDGDGVPNTDDQCPLDPGKTEPGQCGCGVEDVDADSDGVADCVDNCVNEPNTDQRDRDGDGLGDVCDEDIDGDGVPNEEDACPLDPRKTTDVDTDGDGLLDCNDNCPAVPNPGQENACSPGAHVLCVDDDAYGADDGSSWYNAYPLLQDALAAARSSGGAITEIWVAAGTYRPDQGEGITAGDRYTAFSLFDGVAVYGGFAGYESQADQRDPAANETILSGDLLGNDVGGFDDPSRSDNAYGVVTVAPPPGTVQTVTAVISGLTISSAGPEYRKYGASGLRCDMSTLTISDCRFTKNVAFYGGSLNTYSSNLTLVNCTFSENGASYMGGAIAFSQGVTLRMVGCSFVRNTSGSYGGAISGQESYGSSVTIANCSFSGNRAGYQGGAISGVIYGLKVVNSTFTGNYAQNYGGAVYVYPDPPSLINCTLAYNVAGMMVGGVICTSTSSQIHNCILWGNSDASGTTAEAQLGGAPVLTYSCIQGRTPVPELGIIADPPLFVRDPSPGVDGQWGTEDDDYGDLRLTSGSPCADAGDNAMVAPDAADLDGDGDVDEPTPADLDDHVRIADDLGAVDTGNGTPPIVDMGAYEVIPVIACDFDRDGDVDGEDIARFRGCVTGPEVVQEASVCAGARLDGDEDVDQSDFGLFQRCISGRYVAANPSCALPDIPMIASDFDHDGDVDEEDVAHFMGCSTGPQVAQEEPACQDARLDGDEDVDQEDFTVLQRCYSGRGVMGNPDCAN